MNQKHDALEVELGALRPHQVSPALRRGIAERLADSPLARARWPWGVAFAGGLAAACVAAVVFPGPEANPRHDPGRSIAEVPPAPRGAIDDSLPTLQVYRRALAGSSEELDALLGKHAAVTLPPDSIESRTHAFILTDVELHAWTGEL
jgi:hypothetical protein